VINLDIHRIPNTPMKVVTKDGQLYGCFYYGDSFYNIASFTPQMWDIYSANKEVLNEVSKA